MCDPTYTITSFLSILQYWSEKKTISLFQELGILRDDKMTVLQLERDGYTWLVFAKPTVITNLSFNLG